MNQLNKMQLLSAWVTVLGAAAAIYFYFDNKRDKKQRDELLQLEKQIKELEFANQVHLAKHNGVL
jgi:hypothetical protein